MREFIRCSHTADGGGCLNIDHIIAEGRLERLNARQEECLH